MNSRERILAALNHEATDSIPIDFGGTLTSGIHVSCVAQLRDYYGLEKRPVKVHDPYQMLGWVDDDLKEAMRIDTTCVAPFNTIFGFRNENWKTWENEQGLEVLISEHFRTKIDTNGDTLVYPRGDTSAEPSGRMPKGGYFFDTIVRQEPIDDDSLNPEDNLEEFQPITEEELIYLESHLGAAAKSGRAVVTSVGGTALGDIALVPGPFLIRPKGIRDIQEWYISTLTRRDYLHEIFTRQVEIALANLAKIFARVGNQIDVVFLCGTDFGTQSSTFCSLDTYSELYQPYYQQLTEWIHQNTTWKIFKHSCGAVEPFIDSFIESGYDILNPVQCSATGMDPRTLKDRYGDHIVFWGGGVDTQKTLPFGTPEQVRQEVTERCEVFAQDGGFVFNAIHNVQAKTPVTNIVAMMYAVRAHS